MKGLFAPLAMKVAAGLGLVMLLVIGVLWWQLGNANDRIEKQRDTIARLKSEAEVQNAAIRFLEAEGARSRQAFEAARGEGTRVITRYRDAARSVSETPANNCPTPSAILEAPL